MRVCSASVAALELALWLAVMAGASHVQAEGLQLTRGAMLGNSCAGCHGTDGNSPGAIPSIGGKSPDFIETALREFRDGKRPGTVMARHASGYTDEEIRLIAEFFSGRR